jgi:hypothetical protein
MEETENSALWSDGQVTNAQPAQSDDSKPASKSAPARIATAQLHLQSEIDILNSDLVGLYERQKRGMLTQEQDAELKQKTKKKNELEKQLSKKKR